MDNSIVSKLIESFSLFHDDLQCVRVMHVEILPTFVAEEVFDIEKFVQRHLSVFC